MKKFDKKITKWVEILLEKKGRKQLNPYSFKYHYEKKDKISCDANKNFTNINLNNENIVASSIIQKLQSIVLWYDEKYFPFL